MRADTFVWDGGCGASNEWFSECIAGHCDVDNMIQRHFNNWGRVACGTTPQMPTDGSDIVIPAPFVANGFVGLFSIGSLTVGGYLSLHGQTVLTAPAIISGRLVYYYATIIGGTTTITPTGFADVTGGGNLVHSQLINHGTFTHYVGADGFVLREGSQIHSDGLMQFANSSAILPTDADPDNAVYSSGTIRKLGLPDTGYEFRCPLFNTGLIDVGSGVLTMNGGGTSSGPLTVATGATIRFSSPTFTLNPGTTVSGNGLIQQNNGRLVVNTPLTIANLNISSGAMTNNAAMTCTQSLDLYGADLSGLGTIDIAPAATMTVDGPTSIGCAALTNRGTLTWASIYGIGLGSDLEFNNDGLFLPYYGFVGAQPTTIVRNRGTMRKLGGGGFNLGGGTIINSGLIDVQEGILSLYPFTQTSGTTRLAAGTFFSGTQDHEAFAITGGVLEGNGTVSRGYPVNSGGVVAPGLPIGTLYIPDGYIQGLAGTLAIDLGGTANGQYDKLAVDSGVALDGTLRLSIVNGYVPHVGDSFVVMTYSTHTGQFSRVVAPPSACAAQVAFDVIYNAHDVTVAVTPALPCPHPGDLNGNGVCDAGDVAPFVSALLQDDGYISCADLNGDCKNDADDIQIFVNCLL